MVEINIAVDYRGPLFQPGRMQREVNNYLDTSEEELGSIAVAFIKSRLDAVLVNPTGFYKSQVRDDTRADGVVVHDNNVVYGPWLEGTSERNRRTNFKGYHVFSDAGIHTNRMATTVLKRNMPDFLRRMN